MLRFVKQLEHRSRAAFIAAALLLVAVIGAVDYLTGFETSFSAFYLLAIGLAAWFVGRGFAIFISILSVAVSLAGDLARGAHFSSPFVPAWNAIILLTFYLVVVWLLASLRLTLSTTWKDRCGNGPVRSPRKSPSANGWSANCSKSANANSAASARICTTVCASISPAQRWPGQVLEEKLAALNLPVAADANKVVALVEEGIDLSRKLAKGLYPVEMGADGLMLALEEYAATSQRTVQSLLPL